MPGCRRRARGKEGREPRALGRSDVRQEGRGEGRGVLERNGETLSRTYIYELGTMGFAGLGAGPGFQEAGFIV
jgi:hypothetical protein